MYVQQRCKKVNMATYVHMGGVSNAYIDSVMFIDSQPAGSERRNCIVFIGREWNAHVHQERTGLDGTAETRPGVPQNGGKGLLFDRLWSKRDLVHREGSGVPQKGENGLLFDLLRSKRGPVDRGRVLHTAKRRKQTSLRPPTIETGSCSSGGVWHTAKWDSMSYCSSTVYYLTPASMGYYSSTVDLL